MYFAIPDADFQALLTFFLLNSLGLGDWPYGNRPKLIQHSDEKSFRLFASAPMILEVMKVLVAGNNTLCIVKL